MFVYFFPVFLLSFCFNHFEITEIVLIQDAAKLQSQDGGCCSTLRVCAWSVSISAQRPHSPGHEMKRTKLGAVHVSRLAAVQRLVSVTSEGLRRQQHCCHSGLSWVGEAHVMEISSLIWTLSLARVDFPEQKSETAGFTP